MIEPSESLQRSMQCGDLVPLSSLGYFPLEYRIECFALNNFHGAQHDLNKFYQLSYFNSKFLRTFEDESEDGLKERLRIGVSQYVAILSIIIGWW